MLKYKIPQIVTLIHRIDVYHHDIFLLQQPKVAAISITATKLGKTI